MVEPENKLDLSLSVHQWILVRRAADHYIDVDAAFDEDFDEHDLKVLKDASRKIKQVIRDELVARRHVVWLNQQERAARSY